MACPTPRDAVYTVICPLCQRPPVTVTRAHVTDTTQCTRGCTGSSSPLLTSLGGIFLFPTPCECACTHLYTRALHMHTCISSIIFFFVFLPSLTLHHQLMSMVILLPKRNCSVKTCVQAPLLCTALCVRHCDSSFLSSLFLLNFQTFSNM